MTTDAALTLLASLPDIRLTVTPIGNFWYAGVTYRGGPMNGVGMCRSSPQAAITSVAQQARNLQAAAQKPYDDLADLLG